MPVSVTEQFIKNVIENSFIGRVRRVDFTPIDKKPGFRENCGSDLKSAFIHFEYHYYNEISVDIIDKLTSGGSHRLYLNNGTQEYWILLKATNPVKETMMNNHQIVDNCRFLEDKITEQNFTIQKMSNLIVVMNENIQKMQQIILQSSEKTSEFECVNNKYNVVSTEDGEYLELDDNMSISSTNSGERIKVSSNLCGNE
jgi:uncharacterized coiled-coil protein SlyX